MADNNLFSTFEQDTRKFINDINDSLIRLENEGYSFDEINQIFRCIHSIKSEAAYLNLNDVSSAAHEMESAIEPLRNVGTEVEVDPALIEFCFASIDKIGALAIEAKSGNFEPVAEPVEDIEVLDDEIDEYYEDPGTRFYSEFELMLIMDAMARGEKLFRLSFGISDEEAMKYPRAYLAISNLEQAVNVIKVEPDPEEIDNSGENLVSVILSTMKDGESVVDEINIDQLININIEELSFNEQLENPVIEISTEDTVSEAEEDAVVPAEAISGEVPADTASAAVERVMSVEAGEIDAIHDYVSEIRNRLTDLSSAITTGTAGDSLAYDLAGLEKISNSIEGMMSNLKTVDLYSHFAGFKRTVRDIAIETGKKAELSFVGESVRLKRDFVDFIGEPMLQIIRNAVVHGIEVPSERGGKGEIGNISVKAGFEEDFLIISIKDDGAGIDTAAIPEEYGQITTDEQLAELLIQPGYTTLAESGKLGGRGVGLDIVANRIQTKGGRLELINKPGFGCEFRLIFSGLK